VKPCIKAIDEQGKLTPALQAAIHNASTKQELEDIYLPFKLKRRTKGHDGARSRAGATGRQTAVQPYAGARRPKRWRM
jgi:transcriptional accessory protein Tex/SPT6